jgi:hypothetical protein
MQGKYCYGNFENGNLVGVEDNSPASEEKLQELKKQCHIQSLWFVNGFLRSNLIKFRGVRELSFEIGLQHEFLYPITKTFSSSALQKQKQLEAQITLKNKSHTSFNPEPKAVPASRTPKPGKNLALTMMREGDKL